jgi:hypothetical protein
LAEFQAVVVRHHSLEALHELSGDARLVSTGFVRIDHAHARPPERELVERGLVGFKAREPADVIHENNVCDAPPRVRTDVQ